MTEWRLPKLQEDKNVLIQSKYAISNIDSIGCILTCLSVEAKRNDLTSMAFVLTELANGLCESTDKLDVLITWGEKQKENEQDKKD